MDDVSYLHLRSLSVFLPFTLPLCYGTFPILFIFVAVLWPHIHMAHNINQECRLGSLSALYQQLLQIELENLMGNFIIIPYKML